MSMAAIFNDREVVFYMAKEIIRSKNDNSSIQNALCKEFGGSIHEWKQVAQYKKMVIDTSKEIYHGHECSYFKRMLPWDEREKKVFIKLAQWFEDKDGPKLPPPVVKAPAPPPVVKAPTPPPVFKAPPPPAMDFLTHRMSSMDLESKPTAFISYCWGKGDKNHPRVKELKNFLTQQGINVWLDEEQMEHGDVKERAVAGMNNSTCFIAVLTDEYINKVNSAVSNGCKDEIKYWHNTQANAHEKVVYVVMDKSVLNAVGTINTEKYKDGIFFMYYERRVFFNIVPGQSKREATMHTVASIVKKIMGSSA